MVAEKFYLHAATLGEIKIFDGYLGIFMKKQQFFKKTTAALVASAVIGSAAFAGPFDTSLTIEKSIDRAAASSQTKIDKLAEDTTDMAFDYRSTLQTVDSLKVYNASLKRSIDNQANTIGEFDARMKSIDQTEKGVIPLMEDMIDTLAKFVERDIPFNLEARQERVAKLKANMDDAGITVSEKYRKILEAYKIEMDYGNAMSASTGSIDYNGSPLEVDFLRVGRMTYVYLTADAKRGAYWDKSVNDWQALPEDDIASVSEAIKMAKGISPQNLFKIPVPAPTETAQ